MLKKLLVLIGLLVILLAITYHFTVGISAPATAVDQGRQVTVKLQNGTSMETYEEYIVQKDGKMYYEGDYNTIDLTGAELTYE